ncbi:MAG: hypothetical protein IH991_10960, partial [Planctomycetes bacterium]|nr:hypothetical protein [Planctomycetota bacterium]
MRSNIRWVWLFLFLVLVSVSLAEDDPLPDYVSGRVGSPRLRHGKSVTSLRFSKDGKKLFSSSEDFTVRIWEVATGKELRTFATDTSKITDLVLSADEKRLLMATRRGVLVWDVASGKQIKQLGDKPAGTIAITPDGKTVFSASGDGVQSWDFKSGKENAKVVSAKTAITRLT